MAKAAVGRDMAKALAEEHARATSKQARDILGGLVQKEQYVGEIISIGYETAVVEIHDFHRQKVGGIPSLSFLIATRINPDDDKIDYTKEDTSLILLRVMDAAPLPNEEEARRIRADAAKKTAGDEKHWDESGVMDASTHHLLSYAGVECRVIGTFYLEPGPAHDLVLKFGSDLANYYPNRGLKVYKPNGSALQTIVNFRDPSRDEGVRAEVTVGEVRYASTNRSFQGVSEVEVRLTPQDLRGQKTALFGMTRIGKSNTTKIIARTIFELRFTDPPLRIGQIIFDPTAEYANENVQDADGKRNPSALKNVWRIRHEGQESDVVTYGILSHPDDPGRRLMLLNFYDEANLQVGKEIIDAALQDEDSKYIKNFVDVRFDPPEASDTGAVKRYQRRVLAYRALLARAGFTPPPNMKPSTKGLFNQELIESLKAGNGKEPAGYRMVGATFEKSAPSWDAIGEALANLQKFMKDDHSGYDTFEDEYMQKKEKSGQESRRWADEDFKKILEMFAYSNGPKIIGRVRDQHTHSTTEDYADEIYGELVAGKLVIVDQSSGEEEINKSAAERIMRRVFIGNRDDFRNGKRPPDILIYVEEAHNLLPHGSEEDLANIWVRVAKEGAKYNVGMVYATQEVSSIQKNILKNTANWFVGHLNNTDETRELTKFYDFEDFESSIRRAQDRGFIRMKTLSNLFTVPVQIRKFVIPS